MEKTRAKNAGRQSVGIRVSDVDPTDGRLKLSQQLQLVQVLLPGDVKPQSSCRSMVDEGMFFT